MPKEEVMNDLNEVKAPEGWLDKWELSYGIREKQISGEFFCVSEVTVGFWMERLKELCKGYQLKNIWNMDESGCFFEALPTKVLAKKGGNINVGKSPSKEWRLLFLLVPMVLMSITQ